MLKEVLDKYMLGETSLEEEEMLRQYFTKTPIDQIPEQLREYVPMFCFFDQEREALASRSKGRRSGIYSDRSHSDADVSGRRSGIRVRAIYYISLGAVAASLVVGLFLYAFSGRSGIEVVTSSEESSYMQMMVDGVAVSDEAQAKEFAQAQMQKIARMMSPGVPDAKLGVFKRVILRAENKLGEMGVLDNALDKSSIKMKKMMVNNYEQE